nr:capsid protein [Tundra vole stool-associated circular virus]
MAWRRRYGRRRYYRSRFSRRRGFGRRFGRRRYSRRRSGSTRSSPIKLTFEVDWTPGTTNSEGTKYFVPFTFLPNQLPGFSEYFGVYSQFRFLKAKFFIHRTASPDQLANSYLIVSSQPFSDATDPLFQSGVSVPYEQAVPAQTEGALRQARWQRLKFPNNDRTAVSVSFRPYTIVSSGGPWTLVAGSSGSSALKFWRRHDGKRWMPLQWASYSGGSTAESMVFYGPYVAVNTPTGTDSAGQLHLTVQMYVQFKGQK